MAIVIRPATARDIDGLVRLLATLFAIEADFAFDAGKQAAGLRLLLADERALVLVAEDAGAVVGMCTAQTVVSTAEGGPVGWVEDVAVAESHRGQGIGRLLLAHLEDWARSRGLLRLQLLADRDNAAALGFYGRLGWQPTRLVALRKFPRRGG